MQGSLGCALSAGHEAGLQYLGERECEADERAVAAQVEQREQPGVASGDHRGKDHPQTPQLDAVLRDVVHRQRRAEAGGDQQHQIQAAHPKRLPIADRGDDHQADDLHHRYTEVADTAGQPQRDALEPVRIEGVGVACRGREIASAHSRQSRAHQIRPQRQPRVGQQHHRADDRNQQRECREHGQGATAEDGGGQRIGRPQTCPNQRGGHTEQQFVAGRKAVDVLGHEQCHDRP